MAAWIKMSIGTELGLGPGDFVLDGTQPPLPHFSAHFYCGQTAGCIKMPFGTKVRPQRRRLCVRLGPSPPPQKGAVAPSPIFGPFLLWPNGWMHQDATWYGGRPRPTRHCVRCGPSYPQKKGTFTPPNFWPMSIVAKWLDGWMKTPLGTKVS